VEPVAGAELRELPDRSRRPGVSSTLGSQLTAWNDHWQDMAYRGALESPDSGEMTAWAREGLDLAYALQHELDALGHDIEVLYAHDDDPRPLRERRGR
jgi:hypothetical protein